MPPSHPLHAACVACCSEHLDFPPTLRRGFKLQHPAWEMQDKPKHSCQGLKSASKLSESKRGKQYALLNSAASDLKGL